MSYYPREWLQVVKSACISGFMQTCVCCSSEYSVPLSTVFYAFHIVLVVCKQQWSTGKRRNHYQAPAAQTLIVCRISILLWTTTGNDRIYPLISLNLFVSATYTIDTCFICLWKPLLCNSVTSVQACMQIMTCTVCCRKLSIIHKANNRISARFCCTNLSQALLQCLCIRPSE